MRQTNKQALEVLEDRRQCWGASLRKDKKGRFVFYKIVQAHDRSPYVRVSPIRYTNGAIIKVAGVNRDPTEKCAMGLNVLLGKPSGQGDHGKMLIAVAVAPEDVACVPFGGHYANRPKLRVRKLEVIGRRRWAE